MTDLPDQMLSDILISLLKVAAWQQQSAISVYSEAPPTLTARDWLKQFCTIKLTAPRGSGHSFAMRILPKAYPDLNCLLVVNFDFFLNPTKQSMAAFKNALVVSSHSSNYLDQVRGKKFNCVIFDTAGQTKPSRFEKMYDYVASWLPPLTPFYFIILG